MHLFVYEFVSGGGWYSVGGQRPPPAGLAAEGRAMLAALLADLAALPAVTIESLCDQRLPAPDVPCCDVTVVASAAQERASLWAAAARADWTIVIAPEFQGLLAERSRWVLEAGGRLLGFPPSLVELCADKQQTAEYLRARGIRVPDGQAIEPGAAIPRDFPLPAVLKPIDGAGSLDVHLLRQPGELPGPAPGRRRLERYCPGLPASISCLCGLGQLLTLPAGEQLLTAGGTLTYVGGRLPLEAALDRRAARLARQVFEALPGALGYFGIDLVLGPDPAGAEDTVIEINPRLTTSYAGLRALAEDNLAAALLDVAAGRRAALSFGRQGVQFAPDGRLREPHALAPRELR